MIFRAPSIGSRISLLIMVSLLTVPTRARVQDHARHGPSRDGETFLSAVGGTWDDKGRGICQASDDGYLVLAHTGNFGAGGQDVLLLKFAEDGFLSWARTWGHEDDESAYDVVATSDDGFLVAARDDYPFALLKLDASGALTWVRRTTGFGDAYPYALQETSDGGVVVAGRWIDTGAAEQGALVLKLDAAGALSWARWIGDSSNDTLYDVQETSDGGFIATGSIYSFSGITDDVLLVKLDAAGAISWIRVTGEAGHDWGEGVRETADGGFLVVGDTYSFSGVLDDVFLLKYDATGTLEWARTLGGEGADWGEDLQETADGGFLVAGETDSFGAGFDEALLLRLDAAGNLLWARTVGSLGNDGGDAVLEAVDGGVVVTGEIQDPSAGSDDVLVLKTDVTGLIPGCAYVAPCDPTVTDVTPFSVSWSPSNGIPGFSVYETSGSAPTAIPTFIQICPYGITPTPTPVPEVPAAGPTGLGLLLAAMAGLMLRNRRRAT